MMRNALLVLHLTIDPMWEDRSLRDVTEIDVRQLLEAGVEEHLQLDYKRDLYSPNDQGSKEFLLDVCMFANAAGGLLLIGVPEEREEQPTGRPDPNAVLGIEIANPENLLQTYDARVVSNIEDRLKIESRAIPIGDGLYVLAIRIPNSLNKPHFVRYRGEHVYFPSRRERHRYYMDAQEIKEMVMRTASRLQDAEIVLRDSFLAMPRDDDHPRLLIGCIPIFGREFILDVRDPKIVQATMRSGVQRQPRYTFTGLEHVVSADNSYMHVRRNGLVLLHRRLPVANHEIQYAHTFYPEAIDIFLREFVNNTSEIYTTAGISGPYLLGMMLRLRYRLIAIREFLPRQVEELGGLSVDDYAFPTMQTSSLDDIDRTILPLCDQAHQMFGRRSSPKFDADGRWIER